MILRGIGHEENFPWDYLDTDKWPGREIKWLWCHPVLGALNIITGVVVILMLIFGTPNV